MKERYRSKQLPQRKSSGSTLVGLFVGLVIGVLAASAVVWYLFKTPVPFSSKFQGATTSQQGAVTPPPQAAAPMPLPGKPGDPVPPVAAPSTAQAGSQSTTSTDDKPRFDFYKILPGNTDSLPDTKAKPANTKSGEEKEAPVAETLYLQTGSFQSSSDADNQKARLAMMGAEASVQQVMLHDKVWYRVRLGPFRKTDEVNNMRAELARQGIEANVVK